MARAVFVTVTVIVDPDRVPVTMGRAAALPPGDVGLPLPPPQLSRVAARRSTDRRQRCQLAAAGAELTTRLLFGFQSCTSDCAPGRRDDEYTPSGPRRSSERG